VLKERGVIIAHDGELIPEKIEVSAVREQVEHFLAGGDDFELDDDDSE
jgi:hypothetical protein